MLESRRRLEGEVRTALQEVVTSAEHALAAAKKRRSIGREAVLAEVERINTLSGRLDALGIGGKGTTP